MTQPWNTNMHASAAAVEWDRKAATYASECWPHIDSYYNLVDLTTIAPEITVVDIGCGVGHMGALASLKQGSPKNIYFVDQSKAMIEKAKGYMEQLWEGKIDESHFQVASVTTQAERKAILQRFRMPEGFEVVFAKNFVAQFPPPAQPDVFVSLLEFCNQYGRVLCDVPQPSPSRDLIYRDPAAVACSAVRTMLMGEAGALPADLSLLRGRSGWQATRVESLVQKGDMEKFAAAAEASANSKREGGVIKWKPSFNVDAHVNHSRHFFEKAIHRTTLQEHGLDVRVDVARREWLQGRRSAVEWGHRLIELPLSVDLAIQKRAWVKLEDLGRRLIPSESRKFRQRLKNQ